MTLSLSRRATLWGDRTALVAPGTDETFSYTDLADEVAATAGRLADAGVGPGDRVLALLHNGPTLLTLLFAARRRGATLAPVSFRLAPDTVGVLAERIDPALCLAAPEFEALAGRVTAPTETPGAFQGREPVGDATGESDAAPLFLHTGGTTGTPKVVPIRERQLEYNAITESVAWGLDDETVTLTLLPGFHTGGWNLLTLPTLYAGGTVVLPREFDPEQALALVAEHGVTQLFAVAAIYRAMADHPDFGETDLSSLSWVMSGGGPCPESVMEPYRERGLTFVQGYGLTEGGPNNLYFPPERADTAEKASSVGRPFPDCEARLVADGEPVTGEGTGELELAGPVTADGYLATEDGTFDGEWVSTGDVARRDADGDYYIVGRTDNMFVSGGENVYPEAVEDTLEAHDGVSAAGVVPVADDTWGQVPLAVVVGEADPEALERYARDHLADFAVPREFRFVESLPETGAGKLDREALREEHT